MEYYNIAQGHVSNAPKIQTETPSDIVRADTIYLGYIMIMAVMAIDAQIVRSNVSILGKSMWRLGLRKYNFQDSDCLRFIG